MKRIGNLYQAICSLENLKRVDISARKGKITRKNKAAFKEIARFDLNKEANLLTLQKSLLNKNYSTSPYKVFTIFEPKERQISCLPYKDRIVHHAAMAYLEPLFTSTFTSNTYSCQKGRGPHAASMALREALKDKEATKYYLKLDIKKFYPSVNHDVLKNLLRRKIKDNDLLWLLDNIIDSADGLPIGNYTSAYLANFYLSGLDHFIKEVVKVKYVFRYADDIVFLSDNKADLHNLLQTVKEYLQNHLKLTVKSNWRIAPVACGIDFVGYVHFHTHVRLRKSIKQRFARMLASYPNEKSIGAYGGWIKHCNGINLFRKLMTECPQVNNKRDNLKLKSYRQKPLNGFNRSAINMIKNPTLSFNHSIKGVAVLGVTK